MLDSLLVCTFLGFQLPILFFLLLVLSCCCSVFQMLGLRRKFSFLPGNQSISKIGRNRDPEREGERDGVCGIQGGE